MAFTFNNERRIFAGDWNDPGARKLWLYNLHYMAWLFEMVGGQEEWIYRWIRENPSTQGAGWEPYPLSLRLFNWCKYFTISRTIPNTEVMESMGKQAAQLLDSLEFHIDGNHLLENLLSLAFAGFFFDRSKIQGRHAQQRIQSLLEDEIKAQFLPDGGHYELSPMYHAILLERMLDLLNCWPRSEDPYPALESQLRSAALHGLEWMETMSVAGRFALFNDSAYDTAPEAGLLLEYGKRLLGFKSQSSKALRVLEASGYYRAEAGPFTLIFDAGQLGPDHQLGHAQGDMLSFCLWVEGRPIIVHPGNYEYLPGPMREYCRSTRSHNTLIPDGAEQADWWASHRVGWRGHPGKATTEVHAQSGVVCLQGSHDGYRRLPGRPIHRRCLELSATSLKIADTLSAIPRNNCSIHFHFHPECRVEKVSDSILIALDSHRLVLRAEGTMRIEDSWYCPEFGIRLRSHSVVVETVEAKCRSELVYESLI